MKTLLKFTIFFILSFFILFNYSYAENLNIGFVNSNVWYSKDPFYDSEKIKIYTLLFNGDEREFSGKVSFYNNDLLLGSENFTLKSQESKVIHIDWVATPGTNSIYARISDSKFLTNDGKLEEIIISQNESEKSQKLVIKKIAPDIKEIETNVENKIQEYVPKIQEKITENIPTQISEPIIHTNNKIENLRLSSLGYINNKKENVKKDLNVLKLEDIENETIEGETSDNKENNIDKEKSTNKTLKPLKYLSLFFFTLLSFILNNKIIFYIILIFLVFIILRFIWRKFT